MAEKQLIDGAWYWVRFETGFKDEWTQAPAMYKSGGDAWYSFAFAGIPARKVEVLGKIDAPAPAEPAASATPAVCDSVHIDDFCKVATTAASAEAQAEPEHWVLEHNDPSREFDYTGVKAKAMDWIRIGLNPTPLYTAPQAEPVARDSAAWCEYVAGMVATYVGFKNGEEATDARIKAIAGIIERRLVFLLAPQATQPGADAMDAKRLDWILRQGDEFSCHVIQDAPGDGDYWVTGMKSSGQHKDPRAAIDAAMAAKEL